MHDLKNIFIFKTNIRCGDDKLAVKQVLEGNELIEQWSVDINDCDCVLRVVSQALNKQDIIALVTGSGFYCEELID